MRSLFFAPILGVLWSCTPAAVEFHKLHVVDSNLTTSGPRSLNILEYYVVPDPPRSIDSLAKLAFAFSRSKPVDYPESRFWVERTFMKETPSTPRTFVETDERGGSIKYHGNDMLLGVTHARSATRDCWFVNIQGRPGPSKLDTCTELPAQIPSPKSNAKDSP